MAVVVAQAPVAFSAYTSIAGTAEQIIPVSSSGVTAGLTAGNFYLDGPPSNVLNGKVFTVKLAGWVKAHGASQTLKVGLLWNAWTAAGARSATVVDTFTLTNASTTLIAGTFYDFLLVQQFYGEANTNALSSIAPSVYNISGSPVVSGTSASPLAVTFNSASQAEPGNGLNEVASQNFPLVSFAASITNSVSDTIETCQLTQFQIEL